MMGPEQTVMMVESMHDNFWGGWPSEGEMAAFLAGLRIGDWRPIYETKENLNARWKKNARAVEERLAEDGITMDLSRV